MDNSQAGTEISVEKIQEIVGFLNLLNEEDSLIVLISGGEALSVEDIYLYQDEESQAKHLVLSLYPPLSRKKKDTIRSLAQAVPQEEKERLQQATEEYKKSHPPFHSKTPSSSIIPSTEITEKQLEELKKTP